MTLADLNDKLKGYRTVIVTWLTYLAMWADNALNLVNAFDSKSLKAAAFMGLVVTLKQLFTDIIPKLKGQA